MSWDEEDYDYEHDWDDDQTVTVKCKNCGSEIYEEAEQCPSCGEYVFVKTNPFETKSLWFRYFTVAIVIWITLWLVGFNFVGAFLSWLF